MKLGDVEDRVLEYFDGQGFSIDEWPFLSPSIEWRPRAKISRTRRNQRTEAAIIVREDCSSYKENHHLEPLIEARKQLPNLAIYFAIPESDPLEPLQSELAELGIGLYVIQPDGSLRVIQRDRVPFDDLVITYPIEPDKPYRNRQNLMKVLSQCEGFIWWLDKHFTAEGLDFLHYFLERWQRRRPLNEIKIISSSRLSPRNISNLRAGFTDLVQEAAGYGIICEGRLLTDAQEIRRLHDRYIISDNVAFNVLPTVSLVQGQTGSLTFEENPPDFMRIWQLSNPL